MNSNNTTREVTYPAAGQEVYLPVGGTDPDFYIPAEWERGDRGFLQWTWKFLGHLGRRQR